MFRNLANFHRSSIVLASLVLGPSLWAASETNKSNCECDCDIREERVLFGLAISCKDDTAKITRPRRARSITEGIAEGKLSPFLELSAKQSYPRSGDKLAISGLRLGLKESSRPILALAYYRSQDWTAFSPSQDYRLHYGGLSWGGLPEPRSITRMYSSLLLGAGEVRVRTAEQTRTSRLLFVVEPEIGLAINLSSWLQLGFGASYRYLNGLQVQGISSSDLRNWTFNMHLRLH